MIGSGIQSTKVGGGGWPAEEPPPLAFYPQAMTLPCIFLGFSPESLGDLGEYILELILSHEGRGWQGPLAKKVTFKGQKISKATEETHLLAHWLW